MNTDNRFCKYFKTFIKSLIIMKGKLIISITTIVVLSEIIFQSYKKYKNSNYYKLMKKNTDTTDKQVFMEIIFFTEESARCWTHIFSSVTCNRRNCAVKNIRKLLYHINSAQKTLDICMYFLTNKDLIRAILDAHKRNVSVRLIIDATMSEHNDSSKYNLRLSGIKIRMKRFNSLMHHKFVIIDSNVIITGSTNWTKNALFGNYDNILITNQQNIVKPFMDEFEYLFSLFNVDFEKFDN